MFIHSEAADDKKIYDYNYEATKMAIKSAMEGKPTVEEMIAGKDQSGSSFPRLLANAMKKILLCLDSDRKPSVFDSRGRDRRGRRSSAAARRDHPRRGSRTGPWRDVHAGAEELKNTAVFISGSDVVVGEQILQAVRDSFFGPVRISAMLDSNGANTTAAAAVVCAGRHLPLGPETIALVLGATGPVGQRVVRMLGPRRGGCASGISQENPCRGSVPSDRRRCAGRPTDIRIPPPTATWPRCWTA